MTFIFSNYDVLFILDILCVLFIINIKFYTEVIVISGRWHYNSLSAQGEISQPPLSLPLLDHFPTDPLQRHMPAPPLACVCSLAWFYLCHTILWINDTISHLPIILCSFKHSFLAKKMISNPMWKNHFYISRVHLSLQLYSIYKV